MSYRFYRNKPDLDHRSPDEWRSAIETIECPLARGAAAKIVWWDFFGARAVSERWNQLDEYLKFSMQELFLPDEKVISALESVGYKNVAPKRVVLKSLTSTARFAAFEKYRQPYQKFEKYQK